MYQADYQRREFDFEVSILLNIWSSIYVRGGSRADVIAPFRHFASGPEPSREGKYHGPIRNAG